MDVLRLSEVYDKNHGPGKSVNFGNKVQNKISFLIFLCHEKTISAARGYQKTSRLY